MLAVVLFGSLATGNHTGSSDADLLVVVSESRRPFLDRAADFAPERAPLPVDTFVYTQAELAAEIAGGNGFLRRALREGTALFLRAGYELPAV